MKRFLFFLLLLAVPAYAGFLISWQDNSTNELGFVIKRKLGGGGYTEATRVGANVTSWPDPVSGGLGGQTYCYQIYAYNRDANSQDQYSAPTNEACGTIPNTPSVPTLSCQAISATSVSCNWNLITDPNVVRMELKRRITNTVPDFPVLVTNLTPPFAVSYTDQNLTPNTSYDYRINVYFTSIPLQQSNIVTVVTPQLVQVPVPAAPGPASVQWK